MAKASKESVLGSVRLIRATEDTTLYEYRTPRRVLRGLAYVLLAAGLIVVGFKVGVDRANLLVWLLALPPLVLSAVFASWGLLDLITRGLFELEVDRRAKTLALGDGRRIGLGLLEKAADAEVLAATFGGVLGVATTRSIHESRG